MQFRVLSFSCFLCLLLLLGCQQEEVPAEEQKISSVPQTAVPMIDVNYKGLKKAEWNDLSLIYGAAIPQLYVPAGNAELMAQRVAEIESLPASREEKNEMKLILAAGAGDKQTVRELLELGTNPNARWGSMSALGNAVKQGAPGVVELLLPLKSKDFKCMEPGYGDTSCELFAAISGKHPQIAKMLLDAGEEDGTGGHIPQNYQSALSAAAFYNEPQTLELLLARKPAIEYINEAVVSAAACGNDEILARLLQVLGTPSEDVLQRAAEAVANPATNMDCYDAHPDVSRGGSLDRYLDLTSKVLVRYGANVAVYGVQDTPGGVERIY